MDSIRSYDFSEEEELRIEEETKYLKNKEFQYQASSTSKGRKLLEAIGMGKAEMSRQEENQKRREYSDRLRQHIASRLDLPECQELRLKIDCLCSRHYAPDSEEARQYIEKAKIIMSKDDFTLLGSIKNVMMNYFIKVGRAKK